MTAPNIAVNYHLRTKHYIHRYAAGPETLDWDAQPNPYREFSGSPRVELPLCAENITTRFAQLYGNANEVTPQALSITSLAVLLELSFGLSAWKQYGPDRWAVRSNPSSGNLHPTEAYVISRDVSGLDDGVYHYMSHDHALEHRASVLRLLQTERKASAWIALSSVHWREAWKYGERAFRYCQLDVGHAIGAVRYAAGALGWQVKLVDNADAHHIAQLVGLDRREDFLETEQEEADILLALIPNEESTTEELSWDKSKFVWHGRANRLDPRPMYRWPAIDVVADATREKAIYRQINKFNYSFPALRYPDEISAVRVIKKRRSAQNFDGKYTMPSHVFFRILDALLPRTTLPWDVWQFEPCIHLIIFVHRVEGIENGLYLLARRPDEVTTLRSSMNPIFAWRRVSSAPTHLPLYQLAVGEYAKIARVLHCHQAIASSSCFALGMLAEFDHVIRESSWRYRQLHWEAGLIGHVLYLEAEALGHRGTGIGCYFDDMFHELIGLPDTRYQSLYHFTVGRALDDHRIEIGPPYPHRLAKTQESTL